MSRGYTRCQSCNVKIGIPYKGQARHTCPVRRRHYAKRETVEHEQQGREKPRDSPPPEQSLV